MKKYISIILFSIVSLLASAQNYGVSVVPRQEFQTTVTMVGEFAFFVRNGQTLIIPRQQLGVRVGDTAVIIYDRRTSLSPLPYFYGVYADLNIIGQSTVSQKKVYVRGMPIWEGGAAAAAAVSDPNIPFIRQFDSTQVVRLDTLIAKTTLQTNSINVRLDTIAARELREIARLDSIAARLALTKSGTITTQTVLSSVVTAVTTVGVIEVYITNVGTANGTITENGLTFTVVPRETWTYRRRYDEIANLLTPLPTLAVNGTGTILKISTLRHQ